MKESARQIRLIVTYWILDPVRWAQQVAPALGELQDNDIAITRAKVKAHPRRNTAFPYRVSITAKVTDRARALRYMQQSESLCKPAGIETRSITNTWYG